MVLRLTIISLLVLAMISTRAATEELKYRAGMNQKIRSIRSFERETNQSFRSYSKGITLDNKNYYHNKIPLQSTEL